MPTEPETCHCGRPALYKGRRNGPGYCARHRAQAIAETLAVRRGLDEAEHAFHQQRRESLIKAPEAKAARWRTST